MREQYPRGQLYQLAKSVNSPRVRSRQILDAGPGKKYPRFLVLVSAILMLTFLSYLPFLQDKHKGPVAFVWPLNQTRDVSSLVQLNRPTTIMSPPGMCSNHSDDTPPYLLVVVCSAVKNYEARMAIRNSWAMDTSDVLPSVRVVFLVGQLLNASDQDKIKEEAAEFSDILQEGFIDSYANLTLKSLMLLKWFTTNCDKGNSKQSIQYLMKTDDDMYINLVKLYEIVINNKKPNLLMGSLICNAVPIKDPQNKWYVPEYMFSEKHFPNYLSGTGYVMQRGTAFKLLSAATTTPVFHLEDIYITGLLARKVNIKPVDNIGFSYSRRQMNSCLFRQSVTTHKIKHGEMAAIYKKLVETRNTKKCPILKSRLIRGYGPGRCKWGRPSSLFRRDRATV